ncbi:Toxin ParE (plasmid) [Asticcacaulis sp. MM231]|uniref:type II toxin-antitoxin system RelE/ParE family toxin n=1 Tax=Asticcacaulis sp. MM231 TaxID=3157666 RepID=UPI0032D5B0A7
MNSKTYRLTLTAETHLKKAVRDTKERWGIAQARKYSAALLAGFQHIAENHEGFNSPHRDDLAAGTGFLIHLVEHRYIAFQPYDKDTIIIIGIFHESMDMPNRLKELQHMTRYEIATIQRGIDTGS